MHSNKRPRLLIEDWLPAAAIGVECIRERSTGQQPPDKRLHVWWARRPLCVSRAAVLGSLLPADFPRDVFERLLGFGRPGKDLVDIRRMMDDGIRVDGGFGCDRAFKATLRDSDLEAAHAAAEGVWGKDITVIDPMAGGGSIPLESARLGFHTLANEYNPVACSVLEATVDYPFRFGEQLAQKARKWAKVWIERIEKRLAPFYPEHKFSLVHAYVFARTVPCPDTGFATPLVPDWHLLKPKSGLRNAAVPVVDQAKGTWKVVIREIGGRAGQLKEPPRPTYDDGKGISLFTGNQITADYIKAMGQQGKMGIRMYAVVTRTPQGLQYQPPEEADLGALVEADQALAGRRANWVRARVIPDEAREKTQDDRSFVYGITTWAGMFTPRQLLSFGILVEELRALRQQIMVAEGHEVGSAVERVLALGLDKLLDYNNSLNTWETSRAVVKHIFQRHSFAFKATFAEMAPCGAGAGLEWAIDNVLKSFSEIVKLPRDGGSKSVEIALGSATGLPQLADSSIAAVVVDPPYADNVQYSELADFFYVWLKRTQGHSRPEWFSTSLCDHDQEAVVNAARFKDGEKKTKDAKAKAHAFYQKLMTDVFRECHRILRDDGVLTVMFTHKKQEAWEALFASLIRAGFTITATWPVKTESEHSLHQAKKNAAQSTVILVSRKRPPRAGVGYFDPRMQEEIRQAARRSAERLKGEGLNPVDQLVGSFGPAMEVYSRYDDVRTDTGDPVGVARAIDEASDAVTRWRIDQLAAQGLDSVEPEGRFYLLCWDVLRAAEFRYNEAHLLGKAVGMDVDQLIVAGLVSKTGEKINILPARDRRRGKPLEQDEVIDTLYGPETLKKKRTKKQALKVHPNDPQFRTALDGCHALALRYVESNSPAAGIGAAKALVRTQGWTADSAVAKLMQALVQAAPEAVKFEKGKKSAAAMFPEFRAWHDLLEPLFGIAPPEWKEKPVQVGLFAPAAEEEQAEAEDADTDEDAENEEEAE
jgi:putative DNA methylase